jgi:transcriptional regulator with XRE-family HTH domain
LSTSPARGVELGPTLRRLRVEAGLSGPQAARLAGAGLSQPLISRIERGYRVPTAKQISALCKAYRADTETRAALVATAKALEASTTSSRIILQNPRRLQQRIMQMEQASRVLRSFQTTTVIGQAQTPAYAEAITEPDFRGEKRTEAVQSRLKRQELLDSGREFILLHTEGALRWHLVGPELMAEQLEHLVELSRRPNLRVGVIPWDRPTTIYARHTFHLYDSRAAIVTTESGMAVITDPVQVAVYDRRFAELEAISVFDDEARAVFQHLADEYRALRSKV